eukprot:CAMPEP_0177541904 /NCGR_PEP_ID=MMETSP0369-20130122/60478_1 /TAXON_ID=447022 ORGANISM="Scrippsiella hangoei-like, Strain SHHI-4" /NCGR_SAMPLE_ID=MMETSP0369 /ASSEMBLY_ACC=CAM_ASM_000364 /LENGTH=62 /DNA_ID=CAMNT_0019025451 /DNA_START=44 /DNA_END=229 /DNA_ORIENTATION=-
MAELVQCSEVWDRGVHGQCAAHVGQADLDDAVNLILVCHEQPVAPIYRRSARASVQELEKTL